MHTTSLKLFLTLACDCVTAVVAEASDMAPLCHLPGRTQNDVNAILQPLCPLPKTKNQTVATYNTIKTCHHSREASSESIEKNLEDLGLTSRHIIPMNCLVFSRNLARTVV
jgi:hypothetical protein